MSAVSIARKRRARLALQAGEVVYLDPVFPMEYRTLQLLAKKAGIRANQSRDALRVALGL